MLQANSHHYIIMEGVHDLWKTSTYLAIFACVRRFLRFEAALLPSASLGKVVCVISDKLWEVSHSVVSEPGAVAHKRGSQPNAWSNKKPTHNIYLGPSFASGDRAAPDLASSCRGPVQGMMVSVGLI